MARNHNWRIKRNYYNLINKGIKTLEVRVGYPDIKKVMKGDTVTFKDYSNNKFEIVRVTRYCDFPEMLDNEDSSKAIPGVSKYRALNMYQEIYPEDKEALGVYVFELRKMSNEIQVYKLSSYVNKHEAFGKLAHMLYNITDFICNDYPKHFEWYWAKEIPRIFDGTGEIVFAIIDNKIAGIAFLKKDNIESKICTLHVSVEYRGRHVASKILEYSFKFLGTNKPLITIADYKIHMFEPIIKKYGWELTQTMDKGYYNNSSCELVYNGKLPK